MAWCHQATSHYLSQCWPSSMSPYGVTRPQWVNPCPAEILLAHKSNFYHFSTCRWHRKFPCGRLLSRTCWWPGDMRTQAISNHAGIILCIRPANEIRRYNLSLDGRIHKMIPSMVHVLSLLTLFFQGIPFSTTEGLIEVSYTQLLINLITKI